MMVPFVLSWTRACPCSFLIQMVTTQQVTAQDMDIIRIHGWISKNLLNPLKYWTTSENRLLISFRSTTSVSGLWSSLLLDPDTCSSHHPLLHRMQKVMVIGCRLRLHIDGFSECYDFWVNADSADIKPAGWCKEHNHKLHPPKGYHAAPPTLFTCCSTVSVHLSICRGLPVGMKLEAVDKKNPGLVCVASVADVIDNRFLVHFDNWDDTYDYWCDSSSPYIHPVGWCEEQGRPLTAPQGHPSPENFVWEDYLQETGSTAAPSLAFTLRAPHGFQLNHRLEAVDRRNPMLIRVATVTDTEDYRVKGVCPTAGCRGVGHIKGAKYTGHHSAFGCPYSDINMRKEVVLPDRLGGESSVTLVPVSMYQQSHQPH
ncbi:hypothetical protein XENOCAPTIV_002120, partial [Xenoophorus captivus]